MINIGTGPSNARNITDHVAVLRPHAWLMLGHCAGQRNTQKLGDYVLAHGYVREDHVLDEELPLWVPVPALAEMQVALEQAVGEVTGRVPYGTLLCVSDKPLHGEIKLAGMAGDFYRHRVGQHLEIGLRALEKLKSQERERLHSRKLRSFAEVAFQ
jgi:AMP nucleosidase